ncbi:hypothetical protein HETIRDRAFT_409298, partial [Heterobasidion irregulare TC 32-1]
NSFPNDPAYFPDCPQGIKRHVLNWAQLVSADTIPYDRPYIAKIKHCKRERGVWHEFLIIEFIYPISASATRIVPVIVERTIETGQIPHEMIRPGVVDLSAQTGQMNVKSEPALSHKSSYTSVDSSMTSSTYANIESSSIPPMGAPALDYIYVPKNGASINSIDKKIGGPYQVCRELTFTSRVTDYNLAALLVAVHEHSPIYNIVSRQCYWYAAVIYDVFCARFGGRSVDHPLRGPLRAGRFLTIFTIQPKDPPLEYILPRYDYHFTKIVEKARTNPNTVRLQAAEARAREEAAARVQADARAREEAAARAQADARARRLEDEIAFLRQQLAAQG